MDRLSTLFVLCFVFVATVLLSSGCGACGSDMTAPTVEELTAVLDWSVHQQASLETDRVYTLTLPEQFAHLSIDGKGLVAQLPGDRRCLLLKRYIGWKGNYKGILFIDGKIRENEQGQYRKRAYLSLTVPPLEEIFIEKKLDDHRYAVFFDLN